MIKTWHKHYGIYGLAQNSVGQLLVVKKILGPYRNRYDLPGGSLNKDESLKDCLRREFIEETGFSVRLTNCCGVHDFLLNTPYNGCEYTQHLAIFYFVELEQLLARVNAVITDANQIVELNDSESAHWIKLDEITPNNSSPLLYRAKEILTTQQTDYVQKQELDWQVI